MWVLVSFLVKKIMHRWMTEIKNLNTNLIDIIAVESNRYATQKGWNFITSKEVIKAFLGLNFVMAINKLLSTEGCWLVDKFIGNTVIQNVMKRRRFQAIIRNLHFAKRWSSGYIWLACIYSPVTKSLKRIFSESLVKIENQNTD